MLFSIEHRNFPNRDSIAYWEDFLTEEDINTILSLSEWHQTSDGQVGGVDVNGVVDKKIRSSNIAWMGVKPETLEIWKKISQVVAEVNRQYFHFDIDGFYEHAQLGIYKAESNDHYNWHTDASMKDLLVPRKLSMALLLSDPSEFEGGELQVKIDNDNPIDLELKRGRAWFFPSWVLHRVAPVTKGVRRSLVLWVGGPPFK